MGNNATKRVVRAGILAYEKCWNMTMSWNIRGLSSPLKQSEIKNMIARNKVVVMGILETRVQKDNFSEVWTKLNLVEWSVEHNYWCLHCEIIWGEDVFCWTCIYGSYHLEMRRKLWRDLLKIGSSIKIPWLIQGDFNSVCSNEDRIRRIPINVEAIDDFPNWILGLDLVEVQRNDHKFTWTNFPGGGEEDL